MQTIIALGDGKRHLEAFLKDVERACEILQSRWGRIANPCRM
jgi:hypothetical protein